MRSGWRPTLVVASLVLAGAGCAPRYPRPVSPRDALLKHASFDLQCPRDDLAVTKLDSRARGVQGCGRQATYIYACDGPQRNPYTKCTWVMNTESRRGQDDDEGDVGD
jgi:hypothetical protein